MKKERREDAEGDRGELGLEHRQLVVAQQLPGDQAGGEAPEQQVEPELVGEHGEREDEHDRPADGELRAVLERLLEDREAALGHPEGEHGHGDDGGHEGEQDERVVQRVLSREQQREQQHRADLADRPGGEQIGAETGAQLAGIADDRHERADRRRGERRPGVEQGQHDAGGGEEAADRIGDRERHRPAEQREAHRHAPDPQEVELVAGEEEQQTEAEIGEERDRRGDVKAGDLRPDEDTEHELEHDGRDDDRPELDRGRDRAGHRRRADDGQERPRRDGHHHTPDNHDPLTLTQGTGAPKRLTRGGS